MKKPFLSAIICRRVIAACLLFVMLFTFFPVSNVTASQPTETSQQEKEAMWEKFQELRSELTAFEESGASPGIDSNTAEQAYEKTFKKQSAKVLTDADYATVDDVFAQIDTMEAAPEKKDHSQTQLADAAAEIVMASKNYVEGSLERNGDNFTWWTDEGIRCAYNPRMREITKDLDTTANSANDFAYNEPDSFKAGSTSKQVYLIGPYYGYDDSFTNQYKNEAKQIATAIGDSDGYTLYSGYSATIDSVATAISNGAVVLFDSHGTTDYSGSYQGTDIYGDYVYDYVSKAKNSYLCLISSSGMTTADYNDGAEYYGDGVGINGEAIVNHMTKDSPAGLLWMAICLGMATDTLCEPLRENGVEVVYGYSQSVTFGGDYLFEETFWDNMLEGKNVATSISAMKSKWGNWDLSSQICSYCDWSPSYSSISTARSDYIAFPVVVSDQDTHPGQRNGSSFYGADSLQTVKSTYALNMQESSGGGSGGSNTSDSAANYDALRNYISKYGKTDDDGQKYWFDSFTSDGITYSFTLTNVSSGIEFECAVISDGVEYLAAFNTFLLKRNSDDLAVEFLMGLFYYDECYDAVSADGTIDRTELTVEPNYSVDASSYYITSSDATDYFNVTLQLLCAFWDGAIYEELGFGLYGLGFDSYEGYGYGEDSSEPVPEGLEYEISDGQVTITGYTGSAESLTIPGTIEGKPVTTIGEGAFCWNETLTSVIIPDSVVTIQASAFVWCENLTTVTLGSGLTNIGADAFACCSSLKTITIPKSVTSIGIGAFSYCDVLTAIKVESGNTAYCNDSYGVLYNKNKTTLVQAPGAISGSYTIPSSVTTIGEFAFTYCCNLTKVTIPNSVTSIESSAFTGCNGLTSVTIGSKVSTIGDCAFSWCESLTSITIPKSVTSIGFGAFSGCSSLKAFSVNQSNPSYSNDATGALCSKDQTKLIQVPGGLSGNYTISSNIKTIGDSAFNYCEKITEVNIPSSVTTIESYAFTYSGITSITVPSSVSSIEGSAFNSCEYLTSVTLQNGITTINDYTFAWCENLTTVTIPASVTEIGESAFDGCDGLQTVYYGGDKNQWNKITIGEYNDSLTDATIIYNSGEEPEPTEPDPTNPESDANVTLEVSRTFLCQDDTFTVTVKLNNSDPIAMGTVILSYDPNVFEMTGGTCHVPGASIGQVIPANNAGTFMISDNPKVVSGTIFTFNMKVKSDAPYANYTISSTSSIGINTGESIPSGSVSVEVTRYIPGDIDGNGEVTRDDVIALLLHVTMPAAFPITVPADYNGDGVVTRDDVIQLLLHVTMPDAFPLQ